MSAAILVVFLLAALCATGAGLLLVKASRNVRGDEVQLRLRVLGEDAAAPAAPAGEGNLLVRAVGRLFLRAGIELPPERIGRGLLAAAALVPLLLLLLGALAGTMMIGLSLVMVVGVLSRNAARRRRLIIEQLPAFLETVMRLGAPVESVLAEAGDIHRLRDLKVMSLAAAINRKYGGSLRNVLKSLITNIRRRDVAARELRALTAETRFSAVVLAIIPVSLSLYIFAHNRDYYWTMWNDGTGRWLLVASVLLQIAGVAVLFRMMNQTEEDDG